MSSLSLATVRALPALRWLALALTLTLALALLLTLPDKLPAVAERASFVFQLDPSEGVILSETRLMLDGVDIYQPTRPDFFTAAPYPPLYYLLLAPFVDAGLPPFPTARVVTAITTLLLGLITGVMVAWRTRQPVAGLFAAALWLAPNLVAVWAVRARPDLLAFAVNLLGLAAVWAAFPPASLGRPAAGARRLWLLGAAALCFTLGFYFKHTALAAPAAAGLYLLLRAPRAAIGLGAATGASILGVFGLINVLTSSGFYEHLIAFHRSWTWAAYARLATPFLERYWPLFLLPALAAAVEMARRRWPDLPAIYLVTAVVVSLGGGTHGGNHNHLLETLLALALASGVGLGLALRGRLAVPALALAALAAVALVTEPAGDRVWLGRDLRPPLEHERLGWEQVLPVVARDPGPVYSDNVGLLLLAGQPVHYTDPFTLAAAAKAGLWSDEALVNAIRARRFSLIALRFDAERMTAVPSDITPAMLAAIREHYVVADRNVLFLYRPR